MKKRKMSKWKQRQEKKYEAKKSHMKLKMFIAIVIFFLVSLLFTYKMKVNNLEGENVFNNEKQEKIENRLNNFDMELFKSIRIKPEKPIDFESIEDREVKE